jgi:class I fructose-bisphosphate aldolase
VGEREVFSNRRMYRVFRADGRSLVVALDHGAGANVYPAAADPGPLLDAIVAGGADAVLTTAGVASRFAGRFGSIGLVLRLDGGSSELDGGAPEFRLLHSVEDALRLGADAVGCMGFPGSPLEAQTLGNVAALAGACGHWGVPLMAEMLPGGFTNLAHRTPENTRLAARIGAELGADFIKTEYTGSVETFREVTENCYRPVLVLGGSRMDDRALLMMVRAALDAGAAGAVIGRNAWGHDDPRAIVAALARLVHDDSTVEAAVSALTGERP